MGMFTVMITHPWSSIRNADCFRPEEILQWTVCATLWSSWWMVTSWITTPITTTTAATVTSASPSSSSGSLPQKPSSQESLFQGGRNAEGGFRPMIPRLSWGEDKSPKNSPSAFEISESITCLLSISVNPCQNRQHTQQTSTLARSFNIFYTTVPVTSLPFYWLRLLCHWVVPHGTVM